MSATTRTPVVNPILEDTECVGCPDCVGCIDTEDDGGGSEGRDINLDENIALFNNQSIPQKQVDTEGAIDIDVINDRITFRSNERVSGYLANLYNLSGQKIESYNLNNKISYFEFNSVPEGIYLVVIINEEGKLIKNQVIFQSTR